LSDKGTRWQDCPHVSSTIEVRTFWEEGFSRGGRTGHGAVDRHGWVTHPSVSNTPEPSSGPTRHMTQGGLPLEAPHPAGGAALPVRATQNCSLLTSLQQTKRGPWPREVDRCAGDSPDRDIWLPITFAFKECMVMVTFEARAAEFWRLADEAQKRGERVPASDSTTSPR
jgi:hypothetical protein